MRIPRMKDLERYSVPMFLLVGVMLLFLLLAYVIVPLFVSECVKITGLSILSLIKSLK